MDFQSSLLRNFFCKLVNQQFAGFPPLLFQSSLLRNFFCKLRQPLLPKEGVCKLSILVTEELLLQGFQIDTRNTNSAHLSILVTEELLLQDNGLRCLNLGWFSFNPRYWGTSFARPINRTLSYVLNYAFNPRYWGTSFASHLTISVLKAPGIFQSSLLRNFFCKSKLALVDYIAATRAFNPRYWGTSFASDDFLDYLLEDKKLSILVTEELLLQAPAQPTPKTN